MRSYKLEALAAKQGTRPDLLVNAALRNAGSVAGAAKLLSMSPSHLRKWIDGNGYMAVLSLEKKGGHDYITSNGSWASEGGGDLDATQVEEERQAGPEARPSEVSQARPSEAPE